MSKFISPEVQYFMFFILSFILGSNLAKDIGTTNIVKAFQFKDAQGIVSKLSIFRSCLFYGAGFAFIMYYALEKTIIETINKANNKIAEILENDMKK